MFNESIQNIYTISFYSCWTDRKVVNYGLDLQVDVGSAQNINSPKNLVAAHQRLARIGVSNKQSIIAIFDNLALRKNCY